MKKPFFKQLVLVCLLGGAFAPAAFAAAEKETAAADAQRAKSDAERAKPDSKRSEDDLKLRAQLDAARDRLDKDAREVAELSMKLGGREYSQVRVIKTGPDRPVLGVQIDSDQQGARVLSVSPGGPAEEAGLKSGDVIVALDGKTITGGETSGRVLVEQMRTVKPDQKVKVRVLRAGKNQDFVVVVRPLLHPQGDFDFDVRMPEMGGMTMGAPMGGMPMVRQFHAFFPGEFEGLELTSLTPKLGAYFGTTEGVLVVQSPKDGAFKLEDGDVIQSIDGRKPDDGAHALRILRSYKSGEKLNLSVLRQKKPLSLAVTMPDRPDGDEEFFGVMPPVPAMPAMPAQPPQPPQPQAAPKASAPGSAGTLD